MPGVSGGGCTPALDHAKRESRASDEGGLRGVATGTERRARRVPRVLARTVHSTGRYALSPAHGIESGTGRGAAVFRVARAGTRGGGRIVRISRTALGDGPVFRKRADRA